MTRPPSLDLALAYIARGWNPVPISYREKGPRDDGWQQRIITAETAPRYFNGGPQNIGALLGTTSQGLTDTDLDCAEARAIAPYVLPQTGAIFGRATSRAAHRLYYTDLSLTAAKAALQFKHPVTKEMLVELRTGSDQAGAQSVFPGSTHKETGETIEWEPHYDGEPASVDGDDLRQRVHTLAAYSLLARHWPKRPEPGQHGGRHNAALVIGGFLSRAGKTAADVKLAEEAIARAANDDEWRDRVKAAADAAEAHRGGKRAYGLTELRSTFGAEVADKVAEWLGYSGQRNDKQQEQPKQGAGSALTGARASTYEMHAIQWLWPYRFALGKLGLIAGLPDEGKGQLLSDIAARCTRSGSEWPCGEGPTPLGNVILLTAEDDINDTVVPRLAAAGADLERIHIIKMVRDDNKDRMFSLVTDLPLLRQKMIEIGNVVLVLIDPITAYLGVGKIDSFRTSDVRAVLAPLTELATEMVAAFIAVMHFNKKVDVTNALLRISDSLAFGATARHVYAAIDDNENDRKLFVKGKNNLAPKDKAKTMAYGFGAREVGHDPKTGEAIWAPHIVWHDKYVDVTATEAMQAASESKSPGERDRAKQFLTEILAGGAVPQKEIEEAAAADCIAMRTLARAKRDLKIKAKKDAQDGGWTWRLPPAPRRWDDNP